LAKRAAEERIVREREEKRRLDEEEKRARLEIEERARAKAIAKSKGGAKVPGAATENMSKPTAPSGPPEETIDSDAPSGSWLFSPLSMACAVAVVAAIVIVRSSR
jgi:hypothetical protein